LLTAHAAASVTVAHRPLAFYDTIAGLTTSTMGAVVSELIATRIKDHALRLGLTHLAEGATQLVHDRDQRSSGGAAPLQGREDPDRADQAAAHRHTGRVRRVLPPSLDDLARLLIEVDIDSGMRWAS